MVVYDLISEIIAVWSKVDLLCEVLKSEDFYQVTRCVRCSPIIVPIWVGEYGNVAVLVVMAVNERGEREVIGAGEGMKEDKARWLTFLRRLKERGLKGTQLFIGDK